MTSLGDDLLMLLPVLCSHALKVGLYWVACRSYKTADRQWRMRLRGGGAQKGFLYGAEAPIRSLFA